MNVSSRHRTVTFPLDGVKFSAGEERSAMEMARVLAGLPPEAVYAMKTALAYSSLRLEEAADWTTAGSEQEAARRREHEWTLVALLAAEHAPAARAAALTAARDARAAPDGSLWPCGCLVNEADAHRVGCPEYPEGQPGTGH